MDQNNYKTKQINQNKETMKKEKSLQWFRSLHPSTGKPCTHKFVPQSQSGQKSITLPS